MKTQKKPSLPLIRLSLLEPIVSDLDRKGVECKRVLGEFSVKRENIDDPEFWIPAAKIYAIVERLGEVSGDPYFGVHSGELLKPWEWSPTARASRESKTVSEFLLRFMADSQDDVNSCFYVLNTENDRTTFREQRVTDGGVMPRHNDGYTVTYLLAILRGAVGSGWEGSKVVARVCDPGVIPPGYLGIRTARTDTMGASISFPSTWLLLPIDPGHGRGSVFSTDDPAFPAGTIVDAFEFAVTPFLHESGLDADRAAELCGMSKRSLARKMKARGTTVFREISRMRRERAERQLSETDQPVARVAEAVGYLDPVVFSRAFKRWTGQSPRNYRNGQRASTSSRT